MSLETSLLISIYCQNCVFKVILLCMIDHNTCMLSYLVMCDCAQEKCVPCMQVLLVANTLAILGSKLFRCKK